jgi:phosphate transport system permease protein
MQSAQGGYRWVRGGELMVWLNALAATVSVLAVIGLIGLLAWRGLGFFWPAELVLIEYREGAERAQVLGEVAVTERVSAEQLAAAGIALGKPSKWHERMLIKLGNRELKDTDFVWLLQQNVLSVSKPQAAVRVERLEWGNFYGELHSLLDDGEEIAISAEDPEATWARFQLLIERSAQLRRSIRILERDEVGRINHEMERLRLAQRKREFQGAPGPSAELLAAERSLEAEYQQIRHQLRAANERNDRYSYRMQLADGQLVTLPVSKVVRAIRTNSMGTLDKVGYYSLRLWEFLSSEPREANTEGGVYPAIFGTVLMVILMSIVVAPVGVLAALYLNEVAGRGRLTRLFRAAVNNLAGVPSIVYGIFGLGFFVYGVGGEVDRLFFPEALPGPTFGTPGILWASLTLALLTLPVVIVATEEGLARIPRSIREGSFALGATRAETLRRVVLPMASPAIMTGVILAIARAAGEVAPLMLVGVVKLAPTLPLDGNYPYLHLEQKFMHLGFHIYDVGFQSPNIEAARPLVYATALLLVVIIALLNLLAVSLRNRLRERYTELNSQDG